MSPEQIQDIVMGTIQGMMDVGDLAGKPTGLINNTPPEQPMQTAQPQQGEI
jgi:hypothetical protein